MVPKNLHGQELCNNATKKINFKVKCNKVDIYLLHLHLLVKVTMHTFFYQIVLYIAPSLKTVTKKIPHGHQNLHEPGIRCQFKVASDLKARCPHIMKPLGSSTKENSKVFRLSE